MSTTFIHETTFRVRYLGYVLNKQPGHKAIQESVREVIRTGGRHDYRQVANMNCIKVSERGVSLVDKSRDYDVLLTFIPLQKISYGMIYKKNSHIFAFNYHISDKHVECHSFACENEENAVRVNTALYSAFRGAHFAALRKEREKVREEHMAASLAVQEDTTDGRLSRQELEVIEEILSPH